MSNAVGMDNHPASGPAPGDALFDGLPMPVCLVDADCRITGLNRSARSFWGIEPRAVLGQPAMPALGIVPADGHGDAWVRLSPPGARPRLDCRITTRGGRVLPAAVIHVSLGGTDPPAGALFVIHGSMTEALLPNWTLRDPVTGLGSRHLWEREAATWSSRSGCVVFLDLDDLKEVNDLYGHVAGDRLLAGAGKALQEIAPDDALTVRYGGDEFVVLLPAPDEEAAEAWAQAAVRHVAATAADLPIVPRLSHGVASFGPGALRAAVRRADDVLYERKGVLLPAASGGRIILTRDGRAALRRPGDDRAQPRPGTFGAGFGAEFEAHFRTQFARAADQAREFVQFIDPEPGTAVVEVGAGSGRITFEGGLAQRIGSQGQLLLTDPSGAQLLVARMHAAERGLDWIRFVPAPVETLPVASGTADMALGALFLHFTEPAQALREMARVLRPGGRVAICAFRIVDWPPIYRDVLEPVRRELAAFGRPLKTPFLKQEELLALVGAAGLHLERVTEVGPDAWGCPSLDIALAGWRQLSLIPLLLKGIPDRNAAVVQEEFEARLRETFDRYPPSAWSLKGCSDYVVARKPG
jgi:diguanylate cyclase (GGDEF)-like protein